MFLGTIEVKVLERGVVLQSIYIGEQNCPVSDNPMKKVIAKLSGDTRLQVRLTLKLICKYDGTNENKNKRRKSL